MDHAEIIGLKTRFCSQARESFEGLHSELVAMAQRTYQSNRDVAGLARVLEEVLKGWIFNGGISLKSCTDHNSILARLNRLAGQQLAEVERGQWRFEKLPPTSLYYQDAAQVDMDAQYVLMRTLHEVLNRWESSHPKKSVALEMYFWGGFNYVDIGKSLGVSDWTAREWVHTGLVYLREAMEAGNAVP